MNLKLTGLVLKNTVQKEWRSKTLIFLLVMTIIMISLAGAVLNYVKLNILNEMPMEGLAQQTLVVFFWVINIWSYLIATFVGVSTVRSDHEGGVMAQMLSFPLSRWEYLLGRISGAYLIVTGYYILSLLIGIIGISLALGDFVLSIDIVLGMFITSLSNLVVITLAIFFGLYLGLIQSFIVTFLMTFVISIANGYFAENGFFESLKSFSILKGMGAFIHGLLPHISIWEGIGKAFILGSKHKFDYGIEIPHLIVSYTFLVLVVALVFRKKEI